MTINKQFKTTLLTIAVATTLSACGGSGQSTATTPTQQPQPTPDPVPTIDYQQLIDATVSDQIPGLILLIESPDKRFLGSAGLADLNSSEPMQTYHTMATASAGKPLIGLLTTLLHNEGKLNIDDTIDTWLSNELIAQIPNGEQITLRQLLNHTSGIFDYTEENAFKEAVLADPTTPRTDIDIVQYGLNHAPYFAPGEGFHYSATNYSLIGLILDQVTGAHHSQALRDYILTPFGMDATYYKGVEKDLGDFVAGYQYLQGERINTKPFLENFGRAEAPVVSSVEDMALFLKNLADPDGLVEQQSQNMIFGEDNLVAINSNWYYGLGLQKQLREDNTIYFHAGGVDGYTIENYYIADNQTSVTAFMNCNDQVCESTMKELIDTVFDNEL